MLNIIAFTRKGAQLAAKISLEIKDSTAYSDAKFAEQVGIHPRECSLGEFVQQSFEWGDALLFIGAVGIAVRSIAPLLVSKTVDPPVLCVDELGGYVIPLVSGHIGGANALAQQVAEICGGVAVISTATDINGRFSVDVWAMENALYIANPENIRYISAAILDGATVGVEWKENKLLPSGLEYTRDAEQGILISHSFEDIYKHTLWLVPRDILLGIGCRKDTDFEKLDSFVNKTMRENNIDMRRIAGVRSIDIKKHEKAILELCHKYRLDRRFYAAEQLAQVQGDFESSDFVRQTVGVDNVCERASMVEGNHLIIKKTAEDGMTLAAALIERSVEF